jgi:hypothetical protein
VDGRVIARFWGRSGWQLDAVGLSVTMYHRVHKLGLTAYRAVMRSGLSNHNSSRSSKNVSE